MKPRNMRFARQHSKKSKIFGLALLVMFFVLPVWAQQTKAYRIGVITGGGAYYETIDGLRAGLKQLGFEEGKQFVLAIRDTQGSVAKATEEAARNLEQEKVNLIFTTQTTVTIATRQATANIPTLC